MTELIYKPNQDLLVRLTGGTVVSTVLCGIGLAVGAAIGGPGGFLTAIALSGAAPAFIAYNVVAPAWAELDRRA